MGLVYCVWIVPRCPKILSDVGHLRSEYESFGPEVWEKKHAAAATAAAGHGQHMS